MSDKPKQRPEVLYKYYSLSKESLSVFSGHGIYCPTLPMLNDPCEVHSHLSLASTHRELVDALSDVIKGRGHEKLEELSPTFYGGSQEDIDRKKQQVDKLMGRTGVFCATERRDSLLMWSLYADGHRGFCLGFDTAILGAVAPLERVEYGDEKPKYQLNSSSLALCYAWPKHKGEAWSQECEWRMILTEDDDRGRMPRFIEVEEGFVRSVTLGCRMSRSDRELVMKLSETLPKKPEIYQAVVNPGSYSVAIRPAPGRQPPPTASR